MDKPASPRSFVRRAGLFAATCTLPMVLSGCFTMALWAVDDCETASAYGVDEHEDWDWKDIGGRLFLTPLALLLDLVTSPYQCCCDDDEPCEAEVEYWEHTGLGYRQRTR